MRHDPEARTPSLTEVLHAREALIHSITEFLHAREHRAAAEAHEAEALRRVIHDAHDAGTSLRDLEAAINVPRPTLARKRVANTHSPTTEPHPHYDEDAWIATEDLICGHDPAQMNDRGPYRHETHDDGEHLVALTLTPTAATYEPLKGITRAEYGHLLADGVDGTPAQQLERIERRLARAVLRRLHPEVARVGATLDAAIRGVRADVPGAMLLAGGDPSPESIDPHHEQELRLRRSQGFYLPQWEG